MDGNDTRLHAETDAARAGSTPHIVRWILAISLLAAIVLLSIVWITGAMTQGDVEQEASVSERIAEQERDTDTDSIVSDRVDELEAPEATDTDRPPAPRVEN